MCKMIGMGLNISEKYVSGNYFGIGVQNFYKIEQVLTFSNVD